MATKRTGSYWKRQLESSEKVYSEWHDASDRLWRRYSAQRDETDDIVMNILWSNVETIRPAVFTNLPRVEVVRRFQDADPVARLSAMVMRRAVATSIEMDEIVTDGLSAVLDNVTLDLLITGRGVAWVSYDAEIEEDEYGEEYVGDEYAPIEHVMPRYFLNSPRKSWAEVKRDGWVAKRTDMTKDQGEELFGEKFSELPYDAVVKNSNERYGEETQKEDAGRVAMWEIWDIETKKVYWLNKTSGVLLSAIDDPLQLKGFFPCAAAYGVTRQNNLVPVPDYVHYRALAEDIEETSARISALTEAIVVKGIYDDGAANLAHLLTTQENEMIPINNNAEYISKGGLQAVMQFMDLSPVSTALVALYDARDRAIDKMYQISGIADILRGTVNPQEKLGQSQLKARYAGQRIDKHRRSIEDVAKGVLRIKSEIIVEKFDDEKLRAMSGYQYIPEVVDLEQAHEEAAYSGEQPPQRTTENVWEEVLALVRDDYVRCYRLDVETNSTLETDTDLESEKRMEFLSVAGDYLNNFVQMTQIDPRISQLSGEMLKFAIRSFPKGREMETKFEEAIDLISQPPPPPQEEELPQEQEQLDPAVEAQAQAQMQAQQMSLQKEQLIGEREAVKLQITKIEAATKMASSQNKGEKEQIENEKALIALQTQQAALSAKLDEIAKKASRPPGLESL